MNSRSELIAYLRGEIVGPSVPLAAPEVTKFTNGRFLDTNPSRSGALGWRPGADEPIEEVLYFERESPFRKYGAGLLHPADTPVRAPAETAAASADTRGVEAREFEESGGTVEESEEGEERQAHDSSEGLDVSGDDFEVTSPDIRRPSSMGMTFCARIPPEGMVVVRLPRSRRFPWQLPTDLPFPLNGRYERCVREVQADGKPPRGDTAWRRVPAVKADTKITIAGSELANGPPPPRPVEMPEGSPLRLYVEVYPRRLADSDHRYLITVVLRNRSEAAGDSAREATLFQSSLEVTVSGGSLEPYPESQRPFADLDADEQSLMLLYREAATWAIGHGCAAAWEAEPGERPALIHTDVMPAVEIPSMTPDIRDAHGNAIRLRMRDLAALPDGGNGETWNRLRSLAGEYESWIRRKEAEVEALEARLRPVAQRHLSECEECLVRIRRGIELLETDPDVRTAFRLANLSMLLQQLAQKKLEKRPLEWDGSRRRVRVSGASCSPWDVFTAEGEVDGQGSWRAFQIAFLLMQIDGMVNGSSAERDIVDLIWFPTGGGKTEAYLGVMAFYLFHQRLLMASDGEGLPRDGTGVLMRYTLRMLTTQQFQRAASLICAMEYLRRHPETTAQARIPGRRFSLGLWVGGDGTPNKNSEAARELSDFKAGRVDGNPLVLSECPWCRSEIGRFRPPKGARQLVGVIEPREGGPRLLCPDPSCDFGREQPESWIPVEVIDERIYEEAPSIVIATADKFAMIAYRPKAGVLFGRRRESDEVIQERVPPGLIVQDELHLIAGPLGTLYGLYEGVFDRLCTLETKNGRIRPKIIASTATIRGAPDQTRALYARTMGDSGEPSVRLFPSPGLTMGDSFFGLHAREADGRLSPGRLYLGIHAGEYGSVLTAQVRAFAATLCRVGALPPDERDPWWTLLVFYNSLRELGGAKTLFDSDIRARLRFLSNRERVPQADRRALRSTEELTSRLSQAEIVSMMDMLGMPWTPDPQRRVPDACLASSIIEVGVDIDRLSLMGVVGQPKTTAQYIQVTGRVGRRWQDRPGLILTIYSPAKSRDRSHYEQFHSYHRRLYERVEPTSATPFSVAALRRALAGALITWARQQRSSDVADWGAYAGSVREALQLLKERCVIVQDPADAKRSIEEMDLLLDDLMDRWKSHPQEFETFPPSPDGEYLMLWPGQYASAGQRRRGVVVPSSMRQVDRSANLSISDAYA